MSNFRGFVVLNQPNVSPVITSGRKYRLRNDVEYAWCGNYQHKIKIFSGYAFDGATVPKIVNWFLTPMSPRVVASSLLHDALYTNPDLMGIGFYSVGGVKMRKTWSKQEADLLFKACNEANNMSKNRAEITYWAVRLFGRGNF